MTLEEFQRLADTWGADLSRWPEAVRAEAEGLADDPRALAIIHQARRLDRATRSLAPQVDERRTADAMHAVMMQLVNEQTRRRGPRFSLLRWLVPTAGFAGAAALGVLLGVAYPIERLAAPNDAGAVLVLIFDSGSGAPDWMLQ